MPAPVRPFNDGDTYSYLSFASRQAVTWTRTAGVWHPDDGRDGTATDAEILQSIANAQPGTIL